MSNGITFWFNRLIQLWGILINNPIFSIPIIMGLSSITIWMFDKLRKLI